MVRTQIYLNEDERRALRRIAAQSGKTQSELIRQGVDRVIREYSIQARREDVIAAAGIWKDRKDLPNFQTLRQEWSRRGRERG